MKAWVEIQIDVVFFDTMLVVFVADGAYERVGLSGQGNKQCGDIQGGGQQPDGTKKRRSDHQREQNRSSNARESGQLC